MNVSTVPKLLCDVSTAKYLKVRFRQNTVANSNANEVRLKLREVQGVLHDLRAAACEVGAKSLEQFNKIARGSKHAIVTEYGRLKDEGHRPTERLVAQVMQEHATRADVIGVNAIFRDIKKFGLEATMVHLGAAIKCFATRKDTERAIALLLHVEDSRSECYMYAIESCTDRNTAQTVFNMIESPGLMQHVALVRMMNFIDAERHVAHLPENYKRYLQVALLETCSQTSTYLTFLTHFQRRVSAQNLRFVAPFYFTAACKEVTRRGKQNRSFEKVVTSCEVFVQYLRNVSCLTNKCSRLMLQIYAASNQPLRGRDFVRWLWDARMGDPIDQLAGFYEGEDETRDGIDSPRTAFLKESAVVDKQPKRLPKVIADSPAYSSTLAMLQRTREDVKVFGEQYSTLNGILDIPGPVEIQKTVAKMFASPQDAEDISNAEWERRDAQYQKEKAKLLEKQAEQLGRDRTMLAKELENLHSMDAMS
eukprot:TRINITY_DN8971_c0_g1_i1.p1 TRINITY_DN8971_c0_g1~~TRINITY_DN8971_c0_g1_i1.p1  ORF type:complete len:478 (+),score=104.16 TRINITY_DN8971_c0_g1_i1:40-1473(+)